MNEDLSPPSENYLNQKKKKRRRHRILDETRNSTDEVNQNVENVIQETSNENNLSKIIVKESTNTSINERKIRSANFYIESNECETPFKGGFNKEVNESSEKDNIYNGIQPLKACEKEKSTENLEHDNLNNISLKETKDLLISESCDKLDNKNIKAESMGYLIEHKRARKKHKKLSHLTRNKSANFNTIATDIDYVDFSNVSPFLKNKFFQPTLGDDEFSNGVNSILKSSDSLSLLSLNEHNSSSSDQQIINFIEKEESASIDKLENELLQLIPGKTAKIMIVTWNMAEKTIFPENSFEFIHNINCNQMCDLFLFCFQETAMNRSELLKRIQSSVGHNYVIYDEIENKKIYVILVGHKKFIWNIGAIEKKVLSTRITTITKGVAAISFNLFGTSLLFMGSHFSNYKIRNLGKNDLRLEDYQLILHSKDLIESLAISSNRISCASNNLSDYFDYTFWAGDFNFRLNLDDTKVRRIINQEHNNFIKIENLLEHDELINGQVDSLIFQDFQEGRITFMPTYKFDFNTNEYNKVRTPAYTDRILFKSLNEGGIDYIYYSSIESVVTSDHKPVCAIIEIKIEKQVNEYLKSSGKFNNEIYDKCFKKDTPVPLFKIATIQSKTCSIQ